MQKSIALFLVFFIITSNVSANQDADKCEALKGSWVWNGQSNQWQCDNPSALAKDTMPQVEQRSNETNTSATDTQSSNNEPLTIKKVVTYAAMPVFVAGAVVAAIVISPVILVKKIFGD